MKIGIDLDSTLADLLNPWLAAYNKDWADKHGEMTIDQIKTWDYIAKTPIGFKFFDYLHTPGFFRNLKPFPGAVEAVKSLHDAGHEIFVATACEAVQHAPDKAEWVKEYMPFVNKKHLFFGTRKDLLRFDAFIDDAPHNIEAYRKAWPNAKICSIKYPYNESSWKSCQVLADGWENPAQAWKQIAEYLK